MRLITLHDVPTAWQQDRIYDRETLCLSVDRRCWPVEGVL